MHLVSCLFKKLDSQEERVKVLTQWNVQFDAAVNCT